MRTGRPPTPTALKLLAGNPGKRPLNEDEPEIPTEAPNMPEYLDAVAQEEWKRIVPVLLRMRVLTEADQIQLSLLCQTYSTMIQAQQKLSAEGLVSRSEGGFVQTSPYFSIIVKCLAAISKISSEFGLSPSARVRLHAAPKPEKDNSWADV